MAYEYQHVDLTIDGDKSEAGILKLLEQIRPTWKKDDVTIQVITI